MIEERAPVGVEVVQCPPRQSISVEADLEARRLKAAALNSMVGNSVPCHRIGTTSARVELAFVAISGSAGGGILRGVDNAIDYGM